MVINHKKTKTMNKAHFATAAIMCAILALGACVKSREFDPPAVDCTSTLSANTTYTQVKNKYVDKTIQIQEDLIIEGYVVSSDRAGNFFSVLYFQDKPSDPTQGFQIEIDSRDSHLFYPVGSKIIIKLKGLLLGKSKDVYKIGGVFTSFGNESVGRLPANVVSSHIFVSCDPAVSIQPKELRLDLLENAHTGTLVRIVDVEVADTQVGLPFADPFEETQRTLVACDDREIRLLNSGFADFQATPLPAGRGTVTGVLLRENTQFFMVIRNLDDLALDQARCEDLIDEFTSDSLFISELADPNNNAGARFVELYNAATTPLDLKGWQLRRYTNDNVTVSSTINLSGMAISAQGTLVISPNADEFEIVYGFPPNLGVGTNSPADSNGDDNVELVDPFGQVVDVFGVVGEDGSGTAHEFEDGRAFRNLWVNKGNPSFDPAEWTIYNDSGGSGTIGEVKHAPEDFGPGSRD